jgi:3-hydroxyacyl-CoA dehydrogenase/enoyl-CoA hydratase/3-hydroxybutyryl-CoA epimerase
MDPAIRLNTDADKLLTILMDVPGKPVNTCSPQFLADLSEAIDAVERDKPAAIIFASAKPRSFNAGADLFEIRKLGREALADYLAKGQALFERIANLSMPTIAAINGDCLGGGFELALACRYRVAADVFSISIGLPEVKLGLIPAWGGTTRLPRLLGLRGALPILLAGKTFPPRKAQKTGLIDEVVRPEALKAAAKRIVLSRASPHKPSWVERKAENISKLRERILDAARRKTLAQTHGNYPAPPALLDVVKTSYEQGFAAGLEAERRAILELTATDAGRNLLRLFFLRQAAKKEAAAHVASPPREVKHVAVIGGGTMGAGIIHAFIRAGLPVRLVEVDPPAVSAALGRIKRMLDDDVAAGRTDRLGARDAMNRVSPTVDWTGLELADLVVEAVLEKIDTKREVFTRLDQLTRPTAVLASNTSSLRIADIAQATLHPERIVGLHFFNPVPKMPLVEVVRGDSSDDAALATALAVANRIGKTPVLVHDAPGFLVNRILVPYLAEALTMASEGTSIVTMDDAMKIWGMPMGPFELLDEIGLDIGAHVLKSLEGSTPAPPKVAATFDQAMQQRWLGKKTGRGFYIHGGKRGAAAVVNDELVQTLTGGTPPAVTSEDEAANNTLRDSIQWRLVLPMVNEAARALAEGVTDSSDTIDLATVLGTGLAPFRGGIVQFANSIGAGEIVRRLDELRGKYGSRFEPAPLLREAARDHRPIAKISKTEPAGQAPLAPSEESAPREKQTIQL